MLFRCRYKAGAFDDPLLLPAVDPGAAEFDDFAARRGDAHRQALRYADELSNESVLDRLVGMGITQDTELAALAQNLAATVRSRCEFQERGRARILGDGGGMPVQGERKQGEGRPK